jgi:hypothetical protein
LNRCSVNSFTRMDLIQMLCFILHHITYRPPLKYRPLRYRYNSEVVPHTTMYIKMSKTLVISQMPWGSECVSIAVVTSRGLCKNENFPLTHQESFGPQWSNHLLMVFSSNVYYRRVQGQDIQETSITVP